MQKSESKKTIITRVSEISILSLSVKEEKRPWRNFNIYLRLSTIMTARLIISGYFDEKLHKICFIRMESIVF